MNDIDTQADCAVLVEAFYRRAREDVLLGPVFESRIAGRWDEHLERMTRFWATVLFAVPVYAGRPADRHAGLPIGPAHFARWVELWTETIDLLFEGEHAELAKRAAQKMSVRLLHVRQDAGALVDP